LDPCRASKAEVCEDGVISEHGNNFNVDTRPSADASEAEECVDWADTDPTGIEGCPTRPHQLHGIVDHVNAPNDNWHIHLTTLPAWSSANRAILAGNNTSEQFAKRQFGCIRYCRREIWVVVYLLPSLSLKTSVAYALSRKALVPEEWS
jgi:hypothetical protein